LKKSTLRFDREIVTLTPSSRKTSWAGEGRKSGMTFRSPSGSSVYPILAFIESLASPPVAGSDDSNDILAVRKAYGQDTFVDDAETVVSLLADALRKILAITRFGSANANWARTNDTPCFSWFSRSFCGSHSKRARATPE
jgi:hypothetical protein